MADSRVADWGYMRAGSVRREQRLLPTDASNDDGVRLGDARMPTGDAESSSRPGNEEFFEVLSEIRLP